MREIVSESYMTDLVANKKRTQFQNVESYVDISPKKIYKQSISI